MKLLRSVANAPAQIKSRRETTMTSIRCAFALMLLAVSGAATRADTIRIGYSEMLSGSCAQAGDQSMKAEHWSWTRHLGCKILAKRR
jgi:hypothetical protein